MINADYIPLQDGQMSESARLTVATVQSVLAPMPSSGGWTRVLCGAPGCVEEFAIIARASRLPLDESDEMEWAEPEWPGWVVLVAHGYTESQEASTPHAYCLGSHAARSKRRGPAHQRRGLFPSPTQTKAAGKVSVLEMCALDAVVAHVAHDLSLDGLFGACRTPPMNLLPHHGVQAFASGELIVECPVGHGLNVLRASDLETTIATYIAAARVKRAKRRAREEERRLAAASV